LSRVFSGDTVIKIPDGFHIGGNISGWMDQRSDSANFAPIVKKAQGNRDPGTAGDVVKPRFPPDDAFARSGRCDG